MRPAHLPPSVIRLSLVLGMLAPLGCAGYRAPAISVTGVRVTGATAEAMAVEIGLVWRNLTPRPMELDEFRYTLSVGGASVYEGRRAAEATLAGNETQRLTLPAVIPDRRAGWRGSGRPAEAEYSVSGQVRYLAPSQLAQVLFDTGVRRPRAGFSSRGRIRLEE